MSKGKPVTADMIAAAQRRAGDLFERKAGIIAEVSAYCAMRSDQEARAGNEAEANAWAVEAYVTGCKSVELDREADRAKRFAAKTDEDGRLPLEVPQ